MKTLADIKRRTTPGTRLEVVEQTKRPVLVGTVRTIIESQVCSRHNTRLPEQRRCYDFTSSNTGDETYCATWSKASETRIIDADTFEYDLHPGPGIIRLRFLPAPVAEFPSLEAFYDDQPERGTSGEADFGVHWHANGQSWPEWRVSYIQATGDVFAVEQYGTCKVRVLGNVEPDPDERYSKDQAGGIAWSDKHGRGTYYTTLDKILDGWADPDVSGHDLAWIGQRLAAAAGKAA
jgi:hypothetical protein